MILNILAINKIIYQGEVSAVSLPGTEGDLMVLPHHAPLLTFLKEGEIKIEPKEGKKIGLKVKKGILEVKENEINVLI